MITATGRMTGGVLALATSLIWATPAVSQQHFPADEDLELILRYIVENGTPGTVLGVLEADGSTRIVAYGDSGIEGHSLGPSSVFEIGSLTKTFTATLLADMVLRGEVALEDPVARFLPEEVDVPAMGERQITLLDLATHTSGLPNETDNYTPVDPQNPWAHYDLETLYTFLASYELEREPGARYLYTNIGYGLLGHALARAAGLAFPELVKERILDPLGMEMTGYALEGDVAEAMVAGHADGAVVPFWFGTEAIHGAGGLRSNTRDMLKFLTANAHHSATPLGPAMQMAQEIRVGGNGADNGFSWRTLRVPGQRSIITHGGATGGFHADVAFDLTKGVGTVRLTNGPRTAEDRLATDLVAVEPPPPTWTSEAEPSNLAEFAGAYQDTSRQRMYFIRLEEEGHLTYQPQDLLARTPLYARSDSSFYMLSTPLSFTFLRPSEDEEAWTISIDVDERAPGGTFTLTGRRIGDAPAASTAQPAAGVAGPQAESSRTWLPWTLFGLVVLLSVVALVARSRQEQI